jgi:hypothetical protein
MKKLDTTEANQENVTNKPMRLKRLKMKLIKWGILLAIILGTGFGIYFKIYADASKKYKDTIAELEKEVERLSEPIAVYEEASKEVSLSLIYMSF